jgi:hypothetical protein
MDNCPEKPALPAHPRDWAILNKWSEGLRHEISSPPQKKKGQPLSQDGWLFFFVPIAAEAVSTLKEAG